MSEKKITAEEQHEHPHMHMHEQISDDGKVCIYCCDDSGADGEYNPEHYHVDELGNLYSHVHDHGESSHTHEHIDANGNIYTHVHNEESGGRTHTDEAHGHSHTHTQTKAVINRLSRAIGHLESVKRMVENGRDCTEVLIQLAAVRSALSRTAKVILKDHLEHCINEAGSNNPEQFKALNDAIDRFL